MPGVVHRPSMAHACSPGWEWKPYAADSTHLPGTRYGVPPRIAKGVMPRSGKGGYESGGPVTRAEDLPVVVGGPAQGMPHPAAVAGVSFAEASEEFFARDSDDFDQSNPDEWPDWYRHAVALVDEPVEPVLHSPDWEPDVVIDRYSDAWFSWRCACCRDADNSLYPTGELARAAFLAHKYGLPAPPPTPPKRRRRRASRFVPLLFVAAAVGMAALQLYPLIVPMSATALLVWDVQR